MTTIALPILGLLVVIVLLLIAGLILWQRRASAQLEQLQQAQRRIEEMENALQELRKQQTKFFHKQEEYLSYLKKHASGSEHNAAGAGSNIGAERKNKAQPEEQAGETSTNAEVPEVSQQKDKSGDLEKDLFVSKEQAEGKKSERRGEMSEPSIYNIGKSGKIYTEEELELLIKE